MSDGNGGFSRALPPRLDAALRAARAGHHVSFEALRSAVCIYVEELIAAGYGEEDVRQHVITAFHTVSAETDSEPVVWNDELVDEMIDLCREGVA